MNFTLEPESNKEDDEADMVGVLSRRLVLEVANGDDEPYNECLSVKSKRKRKLETKQIPQKKMRKYFENSMPKTM